MIVGSALLYDHSAIDRPATILRVAQQLCAKLDDLKGKTICTYCNGGYRGNIGADELNKKGFTAVTVDGGYAAWKEEKKKIPDQANRN
jgi:rhodanese-related sulfurtransferase